LEGLYIWNSDDPEPVHTVYAAGSGLINTDYIMYIQSTYTATCLTGVSAGVCFNFSNLMKYCNVTVNPLTVEENFGKLSQMVECMV